ncbi:MAG: succinylglutamate desuccinylase/aspartoacylase family protein [Steroidobacteraceae bacterium]
MPSRPFRGHCAAICGLVLAILPAAIPAATESPVTRPVDIATYAADGRQPIEALYVSYLSLVREGWTLEVLTESQPAGTVAPLPILSLRSPRRGPAVWILAGIHGEEPAGPNAIAETIDDIAALGRRRPVVLLPLLNPHGYVRNWRYLNVPVYSETVDGQSVGDSSHLLPSSEDPVRARADAPSSAEAGAITAFILRQLEDYPPACSIDLHEDNLLDEGYVYSQGAQGAADPLAIEAVAVLKAEGVPIKMGGHTRFDESITGGIVGPVVDSSIDELMSSATVITDDGALPGPAAPAVLVFETPAAALPLPQRVRAHAALLRRLTPLINVANLRP